MKKKTILILVIALAAAAVCYVGYRLAIRGTDIIGVTTKADKNTVYVNGKTGNEFVSGAGYITVAEGQKLRLRYDVKDGSFDVSFRADADGVAAYRAADVENLPDADEMTGEGAFGETGLTGKGELSFDAAAGDYTVFVTNHGMVGKATVTVG